MANLTPKQHRFGLAYADRLAAMAADAPDSDSKRDVYSAVQAIRVRYGWTREEKVREVVRVIGLGASKIYDIINETKLVEPDVREIVKLLEEAGKVRVVMIGTATKPAKHYFPVEADVSYP